MSRPIEDYALLGDTRTVALVSKEGSIDWFCPGRIDRPACFAALLGTPDHGRWKLAPKAEPKRVTRRYLDDSLVLETLVETDEGTVAVVDYMPIPKGPRSTTIVRHVEGRTGRVAMEMELVLRFAYGQVIPWVRRVEGGLVATAGADEVGLSTLVPLGGQDYRTFSAFEVGAGECVPFRLTWRPTFDAPPKALPPRDELRDTLAFWGGWAHHKLPDHERWDEAVLRSLLTLKALVYAPSGGIAAAATTSLPETIGGERNWDYRFCWLRDSALILDAFLHAGFTEEAVAFRNWLVRVAAGKPSQLQVLFGVGGERFVRETTIPLPGYENSVPVRVGNAAEGQFQLDNYGQVLDLQHAARRAGIPIDKESWRVETALVRHVAEVWREPDCGIWEIRGRPRHFTHSKVMAWVALDRAVRAIEDHGVPGPLQRWRELRSRIHKEVLDEGFNAKRNSFVQYYGGNGLDASLLLIPALGFLPPDDPRVLGTIDAVRRDLCDDGFVLRYEALSGVDGLKGDEGSFLVCSFWLVDALCLAGRRDEAEELFEKLLAVRNDVGLLAEEYDPRLKRQLGNFPQAFSHVGLITSAHRLERARAGGR
ncbi:MAG: glycoside hydrolase family 15 protein [Geminicoccaceae bacterium]|nr:glycoside hydrolase family 15 protein [Geminicoccaceae bacterium]